MAGDHWVLKAPMHLGHLEALLEVFPDACVVQTHRDPVEALPSLCSLKAIIRELYARELDLGAIGREMLDLLTWRTTRGNDARSRLDPDRFVDVHYRALLRDPVGTVRRIGDHFGFDVSTEFERRIRDWLDRNPQHKHGAHRYSLEQFGLDRQKTERTLAPCRDQAEASSRPAWASTPAEPDRPWQGRSSPVGQASACRLPRTGEDGRLKPALQKPKRRPVGPGDRP